MAHFIDSIEKNPCRMTFKSYCIITDKKKVKQFTVTMKCLYSYIVESLQTLNSERQHAEKIAVSALHARVIFKLIRYKSIQQVLSKSIQEQKFKASKKINLSI